MGIAGTPIHWLALTLAIVGVVVVVPATATSVALLLGLGLTAIGLVMWAAPSRLEGPPPSTDGAPQAAVISKPTDTTIDAPGYPPGVFLEFAEGLPTETLERAIIFFGLLNDEE